MQAIVTKVDSFSWEKIETESEEQVLLKHLSSGDRTAFWQLWERYQDYLYCCCQTWMAGNPIDAEEAFGRAMLKAWDKLPISAGKIANLKAWLTRMTHNLCIDIYRERQRSAKSIESIEAIAQREDETLSSPSTPESAILQKELEMYIRRTINALPIGLREPFLLRFYQKMSYADIAKQLTISQDNVRKRIQQARAILQKQVNKYLAGLDNFSANEPRSDDLAIFEPNAPITIPCHVQQIDYRVTVLCLETLSPAWYRSPNWEGWR